MTAFDFESNDLFGFNAADADVSVSLGTFSFLSLSG